MTIKIKEHVKFVNKRHFTSISRSTKTERKLTKIGKKL